MTPEDEAFEQIEKAQGWRKRQVAEIERDFDREYDNMKRNEVIEEVAKAIEKFKPAFGPDTVASFAIFVRGMKR